MANYEFWDAVFSFTATPDTTSETQITWINDDGTKTVVNGSGFEFDSGIPTNGDPITSVVRLDASDKPIHTIEAASGSLPTLSELTDLRDAGNTINTEAPWLSTINWGNDSEFGPASDPAPTDTSFVFLTGDNSNPQILFEGSNFGAANATINTLTLRDADGNPVADSSADFSADPVPYAAFPVALGGQSPFLDLLMAGDDVITSGLASGDSMNMSGGDGADTLIGGAGSETMQGSTFEGDGEADRFVLTDDDNDVATRSDIGGDYIVEFEQGTDKIVLDLQKTDGEYLDFDDLRFATETNFDDGTDTVITSDHFEGSLTLGNFDHTNPNTELTADDFELACFPAGTLFTTSEGTKPVEDLKAGDKLVTLEGREQPVRFIGVQSLIPHPEHGHLERNLPILIKKHALGPNMPARDLSTTWWHSVMLEGDWIEQQFGSRRIFVPAGRLVNGDSIQTVQTTETLKVYVPMLHAHEVVFAEGAPVETFRPDNGNQNDLSNTADYPLHHLSQDEQEALYPSKFPRILDKDLCRAIRAHMATQETDASLVA